MNFSSLVAPLTISSVCRVFIEDLDSRNITQLSHRAIFSEHPFTNNFNRGTSFYERQPLGYECWIWRLLWDTLLINVSVMALTVVNIKRMADILLFLSLRNRPDTSTILTTLPIFCARHFYIYIFFFWKKSKYHRCIFGKSDMSS